jgi:O-antigen/teichoic acid export membrane protein
MTLDMADISGKLLNEEEGVSPEQAERQPIDLVSTKSRDDQNAVIRWKSMKLLAQTAKLARDWHFLLFLANFAVGKGLAFFGPVFLAILLTPEAYGTLEFALAGAQIVAMVATLGVPSAAMQLVVMRIGRKVKDILAGTGSLIGLAALAAAGVLILISHEARWSLCAAFACLCALQQCGVAYARAYGRRNLNVWIDHAPTIVALLVATILVAIHRGDDMSALTVAAWAFGMAGASAAGMIAWRTRAGDFLRRLREASIIGLPMLGASLIGAWMVSSGRVYMGLFFSEADVYAYAFTFRVSSLLMLLQAVVGTAFAPQLLKMPTRRFDPIAAALIGVVAAAALALVLIAPERLVAERISAHKLSILLAHPAVALVPLQIFFWTATAFVEMRVYRARRAGSVAITNSVVVGVGASILLLLQAANLIRFETVLIVVVAQQAAACYNLHSALVRRKIPLRATAITTAFGAVALLTAVLLKWQIAG